MLSGRNSVKKMLTNTDYLKRNPKSVMVHNKQFQDWHLRLYRKSLLKQAKWHQIEKMLPPMGGDMHGLDIGADNGVISYMLREQGGRWHSVDSSPAAVDSIRSVVHENVDMMEDGKLPYDDETYDCVVIVDMLEHLEDDYAFIQECHRILKPAGKLIVNVPHFKKIGLIRPLRRLLGLTDEEHGHVRPGYTEPHLFAMMKDGFGIEKSATYSRFFVEALDAFIRFFAKKHRGEEDGDKGVIIDEERFDKLQHLFQIYSFIYPFFWVGSLLDRLIFFTRGYSLIVRGRRRLWIPHTTPVLKDGRSIADAALNTKIGSANPF